MQITIITRSLVKNKTENNNDSITNDKVDNNDNSNSPKTTPPIDNHVFYDAVGTHEPSDFIDTCRAIYDDIVATNDNGNGINNKN